MKYTLRIPTFSFSQLKNIVTMSALITITMVSMPVIAEADAKSASVETSNAQETATSTTAFSSDEAHIDYTFELPSYQRVKVIREYRYVPMTAYTSRPEETDDTPFITADGSHVRDGIVAANFLPFGTKVRIPELFGDKIFEVHDRMNKRYPYKMDFWMENYDDAIQFGVRHAHIEIVEVEEINPGQ